MDIQDKINGLDLRNCKIAWFLFQNTMQFRLAYNGAINISKSGASDIQAYGLININTDDMLIEFHPIDVIDGEAVDNYFPTVKVPSYWMDMIDNLSACIDFVDPVLGYFDTDLYNVKLMPIKNDTYS